MWIKKRFLDRKRLGPILEASEIGVYYSLDALESALFSLLEFDDSDVFVSLSLDLALPDVRPPPEGER